MRHDHRDTMLSQRHGTPNRYWTQSLPTPSPSQTGISTSLKKAGNHPLPIHNKYRLPKRHADVSNSNSNNSGRRVVSRFHRKASRRRCRFIDSKSNNGCSKWTKSLPVQNLEHKCKALWKHNSTSTRSNWSLTRYQSKCKVSGITCKPSFGPTKAKSYYSNLKYNIHAHAYTDECSEIIKKRALDEGKNMETSTNDTTLQFYTHKLQRRGCWSTRGSPIRPTSASDSNNNGGTAARQQKEESCEAPQPQSKIRNECSRKKNVHQSADVTSDGVKSGVKTGSWIDEVYPVRSAQVLSKGGASSGRHLARYIPSESELGSDSSEDLGDLALDRNCSFHFHIRKSSKESVKNTRGEHGEESASRHGNEDESTESARHSFEDVGLPLPRKLGRSGHKVRRKNHKSSGGLFGSNPSHPHHHHHHKDKEPLESQKFSPQAYLLHEPAHGDEEAERQPVLVERSTHITERRFLRPLEIYRTDYQQNSASGQGVKDKDKGLFSVNISSTLRKALKMDDPGGGQPYERKPPRDFEDVMSEPIPEGGLPPPLIPEPTKENLNKGLVWPLDFASAPPYTSPGYQCSGVRQPVGVVQVKGSNGSHKPRLVPAEPSGAVVGQLKMKMPTWVSPLYKTYGVGGPYGPHGPFFLEPVDIQEVPIFQASTAVKKGRNVTWAPFKATRTWKKLWRQNSLSKSGDEQGQEARADKKDSPQPESILWTGKPKTWKSLLVNKEGEEGGNQANTLKAKEGTETKTIASGNTRIEPFTRKRVSFASTLEDGLAHSPSPSSPETFEMAEINDTPQQALNVAQMVALHAQINQAGEKEGERVALKQETEKSYDMTETERSEGEVLQQELPGSDLSTDGHELGNSNEDPIHN